MTIFCSILAFIATVYLVISAVYFFFNMEKYPYYRKIYRDLPNMKFSEYRGQAVCSGEFVWYVYDNDFSLNDDIYLFDRGDFKIFNLYEWYYLNKYRRWFAENVDINNLESI